MTVGEKIQEYRKIIVGLTQKELAQKIGCAEITIRQYETGKRQPRLEQLQKIADVMGLPLGQFIDFEEYSNLLEKDKYQDEIRKNLLSSYRILNEDGKKEASKRVSELTEIKKYTE